MSAVTLETLRADFEAAVGARDQLRAVGLVVLGVTAAQRRAIAAYNLLDVAEKHGLNAAMLYKLSDGAIDPRKGGEA